MCVCVCVCVCSITYVPAEYLEEYKAGLVMKAEGDIIPGTPAPPYGPSPPAKNKH